MYAISVKPCKSRLYLGLILGLHALGLALVALLMAAPMCWVWLGLLLLSGVWAGQKWRHSAAYFLDIRPDGKVFLGLQAASQQHFDIIINGTSTGLSNAAPDLAAHSFAQCELAYDMVYGAEPTPFMRMAAAAGAKATADGLGMLVGQAAVSYQWWRGFQPDTQTVLASMRASLCSNH